MSGRSDASLKEPQILEMPRQTMAVTTTTGDPNLVGPDAMKALYGAVYGLTFARKKHGSDFAIGALRARWSGARLDPDGGIVGERDKWVGEWGLPIPEGVETVPQKVPGIGVRPAVWDYGTVAQILHLGPYASEPASVRRLHDFIEAQGYDIAGPHEEEYLTRPTAKVPKTLIRYAIKKKTPS